MLLADADQGLDAHDLQQSGALSFTDGFLALTDRDVRQSLVRLAESNRLLTLPVVAPRRYRLSEEVRGELYQRQAQNEERLTRVTHKLFRNADDPGIYEEPFYNAISKIFSQLGETYVRCLQNDLSRAELLATPSVARVLQDLRRTRGNIDEGIFGEGMTTFFRDADPDYESIKWNLAQNYYVARALGFDPSGQILSRNIFAGATLFIDTNVILPALEPLAQHHKSFRLLKQACSELDIEISVAQLSLDELRHLVMKQRELIENVASEVPDALAGKVKGVFFAMYRDQIERTGRVDLNHLFDRFDNASSVLTDEYQVETIDSRWFDDAGNSNEVKALAEELRTESQNRRAWHPKTLTAAMHDAVLLKFIEYQRQETNAKAWLLTLDHLLPEVGTNGLHGRRQGALAITLDAFLQWLSPISSISEINEEQFANIFSEAVKYSLLPHDSFFELQDFIMFAQMELECKSLPPEDVEGCIRMLRAKAPELNPNSVVDREKLSYEIHKYFSDGGRKYKQELATKEQEKLDLQSHADLELSKLQELLERERLTAETERLERERETKALREEGAAEIARVNAKKDEAEARASAYGRLAWCVALLAALIGISIACALRFENASNDYQKLKNAMPFFVGLLGAWVVVCWFILGTKARLAALGWPFTKLLKSGD